MDTTIYLTVTSTSSRAIPTNINTLYTPTTTNSGNVNLYTTLFTTVIGVATVIPASSTSTSINYIDNFTSQSLSRKTVGTGSLAATSSASTSASTTSSTTTTQNSLPSSTSSTSVNTGLAIGLPIAIIVLIFIGIGAALLIRKNGVKQMFNFSKDSTKEVARDDEDTLTNVENREYTPKRDASAPGKRQSVIYYLKDAFSKKEADDLESNNTHTSKRLSMLSPMLLKKFNLKQPTESKLDVLDELELNSRNKLDLKLPVSVDKEKLTPIIETKLDPTKGGVGPLNKLYITIQNYTKRLNDELTIVIGDKVVIQKDYLDGWCLIRIVRTGQDYYSHINTLDTGMVPRVCLQEIS